MTMEGPGKYDLITTAVRLETEAEAVVLVILDGMLGHGFSVQTRPGRRADLAKILRTVAEEIERDMGERPR